MSTGASGRSMSPLLCHSHGLSLGRCAWRKRQHEVSPFVRHLEAESVYDNAPVYGGQQIHGFTYWSP